MDRLDAMKALALAAESGSLSAASRKLGCSPAAVTRAVAALEEQMGAQLLRRTTRKVVVTEAGERYLAVVRRVLGELADAEADARGDSAALSGELKITAPVAFGARHLRPVVDEYLSRYPAVRAKLYLVDRVVNLVDEGIDLAVRIGFTQELSLVTTKLGFAHRVLCASPGYCARAGTPEDPSELADHACVLFGSVTPNELWTFGAPGQPTRRVRVKARLTVNTADAAVGSALEGHGVTAVLSYQVARELQEGRLLRLLEGFEPAPLPVVLVYPPGSATVARVRAFIDLAVARLRAALATAARAGIVSPPRPARP